MQNSKDFNIWFKSVFPFLHILPFYQTRFANLPPVHSLVLIY